MAPYPVHLTTGSQQPPKVDGLLRLYSMEFCPYAHRVRLVLNAKKIPHDVINVNLINKPEWYFKVHPEGKVPAIDTGSEVIVESLDIANYLDSKYPNRPLYPAEPAARQKDTELIDKIGAVTAVFGKCLFCFETKTPEEWLNDFLPTLEPFERELQSRGTKFFGGDQPGMVDYMLWPWGERAGAIPLRLGKPLPIEDKHIPLLRAWRKNMRKDPVVDGIYHTPEQLLKVVDFKLKQTTPDYDNV